MKKTIHKADSRGFADHGWLKSYHSFSFADYYNPERTRFGVLRVLNDDIVKGGMGFGTHPHVNMEIITIPIKGELAHKDSTGTKEVIRANEVQIMSAGSGLTHSEFNNSPTEDVNLLQIWIFPKEKNIAPRYDQKIFEPEAKKNTFLNIVSPDKNTGALWINQNAYFSIGDIDKDKTLSYEIKQKGNGMYIFVINGTIEVANEKLTSRDAIGIEDAEKIEINFLENSELLLIDLPMRTN
ncbi:MAG: pirin family protein [Ignavibacteria bacterium]